MIKTNVMLLSTLVALTACNSNRSMETWDLTSSKSPDFSNQALFNTERQKLSNVIFVRDNSVTDDYFVTFFVNDNYLTALLDKGFKQYGVCSIQQQVDAKYYRISNGKKLNTATEYFDFSLDHINVVLVSVRNGSLQMKLLDTQQAKPYLTNVKEQTYTLSRVSNDDCNKFIIRTNTLFKFDGYRPSEMLSEGHARLKGLADALIARGDADKPLTVYGYTDPIGDDGYNLELSKKRAQTVKTALSGLGLNEDVIRAEGKGKQDLVIKSCDKLPTLEEIKECNLPNRRVEVLLGR